MGIMIREPKVDVMVTSADREGLRPVSLTKTLAVISLETAPKMTNPRITSDGAPITFPIENPTNGIIH